MATTVDQFEILLGQQTTAAEDFQIVPTETAGTVGARRTLTHPSASSIPLTYSKNPDRTFNFLGSPLAGPRASTRRTLGSTIPFYSLSSVDDVIVTEVWEGGRSQLSMTSSFFLQLWEMFINVPSPNQSLIWNPRDLRDDGTTYNVLILDLRVGGRTASLDAKEVGKDQLTGIDNVATGALDRTVELDLLLRSENSP